MPQSKWLKEQLGLTALEESFCRHYIALRCNGVQAYVNASPEGCKRNTAAQMAYKLLKRPDIRARVSELMQKYLAELDLKASDVVQELARVAMTTIKDVATWNEAGSVTVVPSDQMGLRAASAIRQIESTTRSIPRKDDEPIIETRMKLVMNDKMKALELLGKYFNMFAEKKLVDKKDLDVKLKKARERAEKKKLAKVVKLVPDTRRET